MSETCASCKFWNYPKSGIKWGDNKTRFDCLRYPPPIDYDFPDKRGPITHADMWCGEHKPKEPRG